MVVLVIFLFLRKLWATVIPGVTLPVSLIATFGGIALCGFSLDNLSLMALTVASGFVVDDAIVMIEDIVRYIEAGDSPFEAALRGSRQIGFTIVSLTVSLIAVFIPLLLMGGVVGRLFREFAITLSLAVIISGVVSLTLTPMMCAHLLKRDPAEYRSGKLFQGGERAFDAFCRLYVRGLDWVLRHRLVMLSIAIDRRAAARYSITLNTIDQTLFDAFGQRQIATIYGPLTQYHVVMEVDPASHKDPLSLTRFT